MLAEGVIVVFGLLSIGTFLIYLGASGLLGHRRRAYIFPLEYGYVTSGVNYGSIPLGIVAISWALAIAFPLPEDWKIIIVYVTAPVGFAGILFGMLQPKFMMPQWYRWLEENHQDVMHLLYEDVRKMGYDVWRRRTDTQEGLEEWVAEVRQRHGFPEK